MEKRNLGGQGKGKGEGHDHCAAQERRRKQLASRSPIVAPITTGHPRAPFVNKYLKAQPAPALQLRRQDYTLVRPGLLVQ